MITITKTQGVQTSNHLTCTWIQELNDVFTTNYSSIFYKQ